MTAHWRSGAEIAPHTAETEFSGGVLTYASQSSTIKRSGASSLKFTGAGYTATASTLNSPGVAVRTYIYLEGSSPGAASSILSCTDAAGIILGHLRLRTDRKLELWANGYTASPTLLATSPFAIPLGSFEQCLELWVDRSTKLLSTRYNGAEWVRAGVTAFVATGNVTHVRVGPQEATMTGCTIYYDDMAVNSLDGPDNNSWPGPCAGGVLTFRPTGTAELLNWILGGATTAHECLDDFAPDGFTTYIQQSGGTGSATAGLYFPTWAVPVPASCMMFGVVGTAASATTLTVTLRDAGDAVSANYPMTLNTGWQRAYPIAVQERAWDGSRRLLNSGVSAAGLGRPGARAAHHPGAAATQVITTLWMTVDFRWPWRRRRRPSACRPRQSWPRSIPDGLPYRDGRRV